MVLVPIAKDTAQASTNLAVCFVLQNLIKKKLFSTSWLCKIGCFYFKADKKCSASLFPFQETFTVGLHA